MRAQGGGEPVQRMALLAEPRVEPVDQNGIEMAQVRALVADRRFQPRGRKLEGGFGEAPPTLAEKKQIDDAFKNELNGALTEFGKQFGAAAKTAAA